MNYSSKSQCALFLLGFMISLTACFQADKNIKPHQVKSSSAVATIESAELQWNSVSELSDLQSNNPKKVIVDVYTDWCKWCKVMDDKTFSDPTLIQYLNANYHMVKLNAEHRQTINFNGKTYDFIKNGKRGYNALAAELLGSRLSYPSFVILDQELNKVDVIKGFKNPEAFKAALL